MPLTPFQAQVAKTVAPNRSADSHLAGGAAMHITPNSKRYSNDLDYFQDSEERVATAFAADRELLERGGFDIEVTLNQPGFIRALVKKGPEATKIDWSYDTAWRFLPPVRDPIAGYVLHPVDLAVNKLLALAGRDESRDFLDIIEAHRDTLSVGALCWAAAGKDPGFTPILLLDLLRRRGRYRPEDFARLHLTQQPDLSDLKRTWLDALSDADRFVASRSPTEVGCLYYSRREQRFVSTFNPTDRDVVPHYGRPGGVMPRLRD